MVTKKSYGFERLVIQSSVSIETVGNVPRGGPTVEFRSSTKAILNDKSYRVTQRCQIVYSSRTHEIVLSVAEKLKCNRNAHVVIFWVKILD